MHLPKLQSCLIQMLLHLLFRVGGGADSGIGGDGGEGGDGDGTVDLLTNVTKECIRHLQHSSCPPVFHHKS